jgi:ubiquinone/menaquinone biosynthesis C-methylase UbiE
VGTDKWADWLRSRRDGGDPAVRRAHEATVREFRDGVLDRAAIAEGDVVLDLGTGAGLIGFGALERVGATGRVIFSDVSADLLAECRTAAAGDPRCAFMLMPADDLAGLPDASVDVVTSRSVLMYLSDRPRAFAECARVLRPGGRLSIFEPINRFVAGRNPDDLIGIDLSGVRDLAAKVLSAYRTDQVIVDFDERDLLRWVEEAGFTAIELDYRAQVAVPAGAPPADWAVLKRTAPNPLAPTYEEAIAATLTPDEQARLDEFLTARLALGAPRYTTLATAYLRAVL